MRNMQMIANKINTRSLTVIVDVALALNPHTHTETDSIRTNYMPKHWFCI